MQEMYTSDPCSQGMCGGHTNPEMAHEEFVGVRHDSIIALKDASKSDMTPLLHSKMPSIFFLKVCSYHESSYRLKHHDIMPPYLICGHVPHATLPKPGTCPTETYLYEWIPVRVDQEREELRWREKPTDEAGTREGTKLR